MVVERAPGMVAVGGESFLSGALLSPSGGIASTFGGHLEEGKEGSVAVDHDDHAALYAAANVDILCAQTLQGQQACVLSYGEEEAAGGYWSYPGHIAGSTADPGIGPRTVSRLLDLAKAERGKRVEVFVSLVEVGLNPADDTRQASSGVGAEARDMRDLLVGVEGGGAVGGGRRWRG